MYPTPNTQTNAPSQPSGVEYELGELAFQVNNLDQLIECLYSKLSPILMPLGPEKNGGKDVGLMPTVSPIEEEIIIQTSRVRKLTGCVGELIERAQINK